MSLYRLLDDAGTTSDASDLRFLLEDAVSSGEIRRILVDALASPDIIQLAATRSYTHVNGFRKTVLHQGMPTGPCLRIHTWPVTSPTHKADIHNHSWNFASYVARGSIGATEYEVSEYGTEYVAQKIGSAADPGIINAGMARLTALGTAVVRAGDTYAWAHHRLHGPETVTEPTITLVLQGPHVVARTEVYSAQLRTEAENYAVSRTDPLGVIGDLEVLLGVMRTPPGASR